MGSITLCIRSIGWFVTGVLLATTVTVMFVNEWRVDAAPGDTDATFVAITPCRLADTRPGAARVGPAATLGAAEIETFVVHGSNGECAIPTEAVAVSLNVTALGATEQSFLTFWPEGVQPLASSLNPAPGQPPTPNAVTVDLSGAGAFNLFNSVGSVNVVIDVNGYYIQASLEELVSRLDALETAQAAGVDPALLSRLDALEDDVAVLDAAQPFVVTDYEDNKVVWDDEVVVVSVVVTAPVAGDVTLHSTTYAVESTAGDRVRCSISDFVNVDSEFAQTWDSPGSPAISSQLAGTRTFRIAAGATETYNLVCQALGASDFASLLGSVLTASFTPDP